MSLRSIARCRVFGSDGCYLALDDREIHVAIAKPRSDAPKKQSRKAGPQGGSEASQVPADSRVPVGDGQADAGPTGEIQGGSKQSRNQRKKVCLHFLTPSLSLPKLTEVYDPPTNDSVLPVVYLRKTMMNKMRATRSRNKRLTVKPRCRRSLELSETGSQNRKLPKPTRTPRLRLRGELTTRLMYKSVLRVLLSLLSLPRNRSLVSPGFRLPVNPRPPYVPMKYRKYRPS